VGKFFSVSDAITFFFPLPEIGNAATLSAQKKASECAALNQLNADSNRPAAAVRLPGTASQVRAKLLPPAPCPNCCVDGAKPATRPTSSAHGNTQQSSIDVDAQTESNHDTALTLAAAGGHGRLVSLLLSRGANVEHRDKKGTSIN
jgi:Ankyrin repeat